MPSSLPNAFHLAGVGGAVPLMMALGAGQLRLQRLPESCLSASVIAAPLRPLLEELDRKPPAIPPSPSRLAH